MRQYVIFYKRGVGGEFSQLNKNDHANLVDRQEVRDAVDHMRAHSCVAGICLQMDDETYNIMSFSQEAHAPDAFIFEDIE